MIAGPTDRMPFPNRLHVIPLVITFAAAICAAGCRAAGKGEPIIEFSNVPAAAEGGPQTVASISGRVSGARPGQRVVLFARSGDWWVQPYTTEPFTAIQPDGTWTSSTHLGSEYAALLVDPGYKPPPRVDALPAPGGVIASVAVVRGTRSNEALPPPLQFSGYKWQPRHAASDRGGTPNTYDPSNAWTDDKGSLHLSRCSAPGPGRSTRISSDAARL
jgi:hypothetical protein